MKKYQWIIFDADETLFHFDNFAGLKHMFAKYGVSFSEEDFAQYQSVNKPLWVEYQDGKITAEQLQTRRFEQWAKRLKVTAKQLNHEFLESMADICQPLPGAKELMQLLKDKGIKAAIITNGFTQLQQIRLERTGFKAYFSHVVISEEVGIAKPNKAIFDHTLDKMGNPELSQVLMVGDTLESDILGGINTGLETCWINHHAKEHPDHIKPTYEITALSELTEKLASLYEQKTL